MNCICANSKPWARPASNKGTNVNWAVNSKFECKALNSYPSSEFSSELDPCEFGVLNSNLALNSRFECKALNSCPRSEFSGPIACSHRLNFISIRNLGISSQKRYLRSAMRTIYDLKFTPIIGISEIWVHNSCFLRLLLKLYFTVQNTQFTVHISKFVL